jgi:DNA-binding HxlR family transcriptional regulator
MNAQMNVQIDSPPYTDTVCPKFHHAVELIGRKWTGAILLALQSGKCRFTEIAAMVPGLSDRLLSERLKELEAEGIVRRIVTPETPVRIEYRLTEKGDALDVVMASISHWAEEWIDPAVAKAACDAASHEP